MEKASTPEPRLNRAGSRRGSRLRPRTLALTGAPDADEIFADAIESIVLPWCRLTSAHLPSLHQPFLQISLPCAFHCVLHLLPVNHTPVLYELLCDERGRRSDRHEHARRHEAFECLSSSSARILTKVARKDNITHTRHDLAFALDHSDTAPLYHHGSTQTSPDLVFEQVMKHLKGHDVVPGRSNMDRGDEQAYCGVWLS